MENQLKWYQKPVAVVLFLIFFFPVGLYLMWKNELWSKKARVVVTVFFGLLILGSLNNNNESNCNDIYGTYSGTSKMGYTNGSAKITINNDCTANLTYEQGDFGNATENGIIVKDGTFYKFKSNGGGVYKLRISNNKIILEGYNWKCILIK